MSFSNLRLIGDTSDLVAGSKPKDREMERIIISTFITMGRVAIRRYHGIMKESWFTDSVYKRVYRVIVQMYEEGLEIDVSVLRLRLLELIEWGELNEADERLTLALNEESKLENIDNYAEILAEKHCLRQLQNKIMKVWGLVNRDIDRVATSDTTAKICAQIINEVREISKEGIVHLGESLGDLALQRAEYRKMVTGLNQHYTGLPIGIEGIDEMTLGCQKGDLVIIGARPSIGKTGALISFMRNASKTEPKKTFAVQTNEMTTEAITDRWLSQETGISMARIRCPMYLTEKDNNQLAKATQDLKDSNVRLNGDRIDSDQMVMNWYRLADRGELGAIGVDYIQLIARREIGKYGDSMVRAVGEIGAKFKTAALDLKVPLFALSQLKREVDERPDHHPVMSDLSDASSLEADADLIMLLYREDRYDKEIAPGTMEIILDKHRNGPTGMVPVRFNLECASVSNLQMTRQSNFITSLKDEINNTMKGNLNDRSKISISNRSLCKKYP